MKKLWQRAEMIVLLALVAGSIWYFTTVWEVKK